MGSVRKLNFHAQVRKPFAKHKTSPFSDKKESYKHNHLSIFIFIKDKVEVELLFRCWFCITVNKCSERNV